MKNIFKKGPNDIEQPVERCLLFAVYDEKAEAYGSGIAVHPTISVAIRSFTAACQNSQSLLNQFPSDYALYHIGYYDEQTARITSFPEPRFVIRASEIVNHLKNEKIQEAAGATS